jgi:hypothetical protein
MWTSFTEIDVYRIKRRLPLFWRGVVAADILGKNPIALVFQFVVNAYPGSVIASNRKAFQLAEEPHFGRSVMCSLWREPSAPRLHQNWNQRKIARCSVGHKIDQAQAFTPNRFFIVVGGFSRNCSM